AVVVRDHADKRGQRGEATGADDAHVRAVQGPDVDGRVIGVRHLERVRRVARGNHKGEASGGSRYGSGRRLERADVSQANGTRETRAALVGRQAGRIGTVVDGGAADTKGVRPRR